MDKKKTLTIVGIVLLVVLLIIGCCIGGGDDNGSSTKKALSNDSKTILANAQKESQSIKEEEMEELDGIDINTYLDYYNGSSNKLVLIARPTCGYCQVATPILKKLKKDYNIELNYLNTDEMAGEDTAKFTSSDEKFSQGFGTPMLLIVGNGKIVDMVDGLTDTAHYIDFLERNNIIK